jgi:hypothetical protein
MEGGLLHAAVEIAGPNAEEPGCRRMRATAAGDTSLVCAHAPLASEPVSSATDSAPGAPQNQEDDSHDEQNSADVVEQANACGVADDQQNETENDHN